MDDATLLANIERLLKEQGRSADAVSKEAGKPDAIRNLRRRVNGEKQGSWTLETLTRVARALETTGWELMRPIGALPQASDKSREMVREIVREELGISSSKPAKRRRA